MGKEPRLLNLPRGATAGGEAEGPSAGGEGKATGGFGGREVTEEDKIRVEEKIRVRAR